MLFQGQEFSASAPFLYFADFDAELAQRCGRARRIPRAVSRASSIRGSAASWPIPARPSTFERCKLDFGERESHADGLRAARGSAAAAARRRACSRRARRGGVDGAVLSRVGLRVALLHAGSSRRSAADRQPRRRAARAARSPSRCWRRRARTRDWAACRLVEWSAKRRRTAGPARPICYPTTAGASPPNRALLSRAGAAPAARHRCRCADRTALTSETMAEPRSTASPGRPPAIDRSRIAGDARVARHQRPRRLRVGHRRRSDHAALSRAADRGAAGAARPHRDAEPRRRAADASPAAAASRSAGASARATPPMRTAPAT